MKEKKCKYPCNGACKICDRRMWVCLGFGLESRDTRSLFDYLSCHFCESEKKALGKVKAMAAMGIK